MSNWRERTSELPIMSWQLAASIACHQPKPMPVAQRSFFARLASGGALGALLGALMFLAYAIGVH